MNIGQQERGFIMKLVELLCSLNGGTRIEVFRFPELPIADAKIEDLLFSEVQPFLLEDVKSVFLQGHLMCKI